MARNVEIKARIASVESLLPLTAALANEGPIEIRQDDTFFRCATGRLKLRYFLNGTGELIFYRRANQSGPKESFTFAQSRPLPKCFESRWCSPTGRLVAWSSTAHCFSLVAAAYTWTAWKG